MKLINIGFGNMVSANRLIAIVSPESAPIKRIIQDARERGMLIEATNGRRTRAVIAAGVVITHHERTNLPSALQQIDKFFRAERGRLTRKGNARHLGGSKRGKDPVSLGNIRKQAYAPAEHLHRMVGKRKNDRLCAALLRFLRRPPDQRPVAKVHAVEHTKRDDGGNLFLHTNLMPVIPAAHTRVQNG